MSSKGGTEVDRLEVKVQASAEDANKQIDLLIKKLEKINVTMRSVGDNKGTDKMGAGFKELGNSSGLRESVKNISDFYKAYRKLTKLDVSNISKVTDSVKELGKALQGLPSTNLAIKISAKELNPGQATKIRNDMMKSMASVSQVNPTVTVGDQVFENLEAYGRWQQEIENTAADQRDLQSTMQSFNQQATTVTQTTQAVSNAMDNGGKKVSMYSNAIKMAAGSVAGVKTRFSDILHSVSLTSGIKIPTGEYKALTVELSKQNSAFDRLIDREEKYLSLGTSKNSRQWKSLQYDIEASADKIQKLKNQMKGLEESGKAFKFNLDIPGLFKGGGSSAKSALGNIAKQLSGLRSIGKSFPSMSNIKGLGNVLESSGKKVLSFGRMFQLMLARMAMRNAINGAKEGFNNLVQYSDVANASVSTLYSGLMTLKNAFAVAFNPILQIVTPYLSTLINYAVNASNAVAQLFAALTGQKTWVKAISVQQNYAQSLETSTKAANDLKKATTTLGIDELNINAPESGGGGGASSGGTPSVNDMFSTEEVSSQIFNWAELIKKAWDDADFTSLGSTLSTKIATSLDSINWDSVSDSFAKVGKCIATGINGFVTPNLFSSLGRTIAGAINSAISGEKSFAENLDFTNIGVSVGTGVNTMLKGIKWDDVLSSASTWGQGIANTLNGFIKTTDFNTVGGTIANVLNTAITFALSAGETFDFAEFGTAIGEAINGFFKNFKFKDLAKTLNKWSDGIFTTITTALDTITWSDVWDGITDFLSELNVSTAVIIATGFFVKSGAAGALVSLTKTKLKELLLEKIGVFGTASVASIAFDVALIATITGLAIKYGPEIEKGAQKWLLEKLFGASKEDAETTVEANVRYINNGEITNGNGEKVGEYETGIETIKGWGADIDKWWTGTDLYKFFANPDTYFINWGIKLQTAWGKLSGDFNDWKIGVGAYFTTKAEDVAGWWSDVVTWWGDRIVGVESTVDDIKAHVSAKWDEVVTFWKDKNPLSKVKTTYEDFAKKVGVKWDEVITFWKNKELLSKVKTTYEDIKAKVKEKWDLVVAYWRDKDLLSEVQTTYEDFKEKVNEKWKAVTKFWSEKTDLSEIKITMSDILSTAQSAWKNLKQWWDDNVKLSIPSLSFQVSYNQNVTGISKKIVDALNLPGWPTLSFYKNGGFPDVGDLFFANENGVPELVGTMNGKPAVGSGMEITGISDAVYNTSQQEMALLREQNALLRELVRKDFGTHIGDKEIARANIRGQRQLGMQLRTT